MEVQTCTVIRKTVGDVDFNSVTPVCFDRRTYRAKNSSQHGVSDITIVSWYSSKVLAARSAPERPVRSLNLDREIGWYLSISYLECCHLQ